MEKIESLNYESFLKAIDHIYDIIEIWDNNYHLIYTNSSSYNLLGVEPKYLKGKHLDELMGEKNYWNNSALPFVYKNKKSTMHRQKTAIGTEILTIAVPILDQNGEVEFVVMSARDSYDALSQKLAAVSNHVSDEPTSPNDSGIIYNHISMKNVINTAKKVAINQVNCLILGETGTGKSRLAKFIHRNSDRHDKNLITLNMASMNSSIIESELFGYVKGAFTGANQQGKKGLFEVASEGTLFLDEIGELPLNLQAKFLHVLQEKEFTPIGGTNSIKVDLHIIAATNCNLEEMVNAGSFREDLYHRLNVIEIMIPPLRERGNDLDLMISFFVNQFNKKYRKNCVFTVLALKHLQQYRWPGNIRELANVVERCVIMADNDEITSEDLPKHIFKITQFANQTAQLDEVTDLHKKLDEYEKEIVCHHYKKHPSTRKLAQALGISQTSARRMIDKHIKP